MPPIRLQKILAQAGVASRRHAEALITSGRIRVNGRIVTELGAKADPKKDRIELDGKRLVLESPVYILLHKPRCVMSTVSDPEGRPTVLEYMRNLPARVFPVGRLDFQTSGALLLTNDGEFMAKLLHPRHHVPKTYLVKLLGEMKEEDLERWRNGVELEDGKTAPAHVTVVRREPGKTWLEVILREGRNQQIRRMGEATGFRVQRLTRTAFAGVLIEGMRAGQWRFLTYDELRDLRASYGVPRRIRSALDAQNKIARETPSLGQEPKVRRTSPAPTAGAEARTTSERRSPRETRSGAGPAQGRPVRSTRSDARSDSGRRSSPRTEAAQDRPARSKTGSSPPRGRGPSRPEPQARAPRAPARRQDQNESSQRPRGAKRPSRPRS